MRAEIEKQQTSDIDFLGWFNVFNRGHLRGYYRFVTGGKWPEGFIPENAVMKEGWETELDHKIGWAWVIACVGKDGNYEGNDIGDPISSNSNFSEWFNVSNRNHLRNYYQFVTYKQWTDGFLPENIVIIKEWQSFLDKKLAWVWITTWLGEDGNAYKGP